MNILTINAGSSSLKFSVYCGDEPGVYGSFVRVGQRDGKMLCRDSSEYTLVDMPLDLTQPETAIRELLNWLHAGHNIDTLAAIGHRIVHGGKLTQPQCITPDTLLQLTDLIPMAPDHLPAEIAAIQALQTALPGLPQVACFDTAFHRAMPAVARLVPLPAEYRDGGIERYGFHGLSYQYIVHKLTELPGPQAGGRAVIAHLGSGASLAAVREGKPIDTTMGLTPLGGLVMSTRTGDLDPGIVLYLQRKLELSANQVNDLLNKQSGLLGVSGTSGDMQSLLAHESTDANAALATELFCYQARKHIAAMAASLGGIDTLVFTGGIGEHAAPIRQRIVSGLAFLGLSLDEARNASALPIISCDNSSVTVRMIPTNEELMIARLTRQLL